MNPDDFKSALLARLGLTPAPPSNTPSPAPRPVQYPGWARQDVFSSPSNSGGAATDSANVARLSRSAFADSLRQIVPGGTIQYGGDNGPLMGEHRGSTGRTGQTPADTVFIYHLGLRDTGGLPSEVKGGVPHVSTLPENTLAHEFGHRYAQRGLLDQLTGSPFEQFKTAVARSPLKMPAQQYGSAQRGGVDEQFPEAFANAVDFLRATAASQPTASLSRDVAGTLSQYEREVPGTKTVLGMLLKEPLYARHPLNVSRSVAQMAVRPDATATQAPSPTSSQLLAAALGAALKKP